MIKKCLKHPNYKIKGYPTSRCPACLYLYYKEYPQMAIKRNDALDAFEDLGEILNNIILLRGKSNG